MIVVRRPPRYFADFIFIVTVLLVGVVILVAAQDAGATGCHEWEWDPADSRLTAWDGRNLHGEPDHIRKLFYDTWQAGKPWEGEAWDGLHVRRWRWEYECRYPPPPSSSAFVSRPSNSDSPSPQSLSSRPLSETWPGCYRFLYYLEGAPEPQRIHENGNEAIYHPTLSWECQRGPS